MSKSESARKITPGSVILYRELRPDFPLWPAIYLTDEAAPKSFLDTRPHGFFSVVLKLASVQDCKNLRWAQTSQMIPFDPSAADAATKRSIPDLIDAYDAARTAEQSDLDLDYWKVILASTVGPEVISIDDEDDFSNDPEIMRAIELSLQDQHSHQARQRLTYPTYHSSPNGAERGFSSSSPRGSKLYATDGGRSLPIRRPVKPPPRLVTPSPSPPTSYSFVEQFSPTSKRPIPPSNFDSDDEAPSPSQKRRLNSQLGSSGRSDVFQSTSWSSYDSRSPTFGFSDGLRKSTPRAASTSATGSHDTSAQTSQLPVARTKKSSSGPSARKVFRRNGLNAPKYAVPDEDTLEEDLDDSSHFVQVYIGPDTDPTTDKNIDPERRRYKFQLMKRDVWDRSYFRDGVSARHYFAPIGDNTWELAHPRLEDISPGDFQMVAEFLTDGDFGIRKPETEEQVAESFAECIAAWKAAEKLGMDDLLKLIVRKMRQTRGWWDMFHVMVFACEIYNSDLSLDDHNEMRAMLSEAIAEDYDIYIEDDILRGQFMTRLKQLPELRRDVYATIVEQINRRLHPQAEEAAVLQGDDNEEGDIDLYK